MAKCFFTGIEIQLDDAFLLDRGNAQRAVRYLKQRLTALERLVQQLSPADEVQVLHLQNTYAAKRDQTRGFRVTSRPSFIDQDYLDAQFPGQLNGTHFPRAEPCFLNCLFKVGHRPNRRHFDPGRERNRPRSRTSGARDYDLVVNFRGNVDGFEELPEQIKVSNA
jgi:hypothetical protein